MTEHDTPYQEELDVAVAAVRRAARMIREHAGGLDRKNVSLKGRHDLVTHVDLASQRIIVGILNDHFPDHAVLAEEDDDASDDAGEEREYRWIIDPVDGTTNFAHGIPAFSVSVGLERRGEMVAGVVLDVPRDELFTAVRGGGLYVDGVRAGVSAVETLDESVIMTGFPYRSVGHLDRYLSVLGGFMRRAEGVRRPGSAALDLAYVACGRAEGFFESGLYAWDVAAGSLLVAEGGGRVSDFRGDPDALFARQIVASNGHVHDAMLDLVEPLRDVVD